MPTTMSTDRSADFRSVFRSVFRHHAAGVAVITADPGGRPVALTVSSLSSVSVEPPQLAFSVSAASSSAQALLASDSIVVHVLGETDVDLARLCSTSGADRFSGSPWARMPDGTPYFPSVDNRIHGEIATRFDAAGATLVLVRAVQIVSAPAAPARPLVYHDRSWHALDERSQIHGPQS